MLGIGVAVCTGGGVMGGADLVGVGTIVADLGVTVAGSRPATVGTGVAAGGAVLSSGSNTAITTRSPLIVTVLEGPVPSSKSSGDQ